MKSFYLCFSFICIVLASCTTKLNEKTEGEIDERTLLKTEDLGLLVEKFNDFKKCTSKNISTNLFLINDKWMLVSAGNDSIFNTMTASWGGFGTGWNKPIAFMFIKDSRYTFEFLQKDSVYTLTFFDEKYKDTMKMLGGKSGRDSDKIKDSGLTPLIMPSGAPSFKEASMIIECRKLISQPIETSSIKSEEVLNFYNEESSTHNIFFGEIIGVWKK